VKKMRLKCERRSYDHSAENRSHMLQLTQQQIEDTKSSVYDYGFNAFYGFKTVP